MKGNINRRRKFFETVRGYYEKHYVNNFQQEMDKFLKYKSPKTTHVETENLKGPINILKIFISSLKYPQEEC